VAYVSLQKDAAAAEARQPSAGFLIYDWTDELRDFADTAALIEALDLLIALTLRSFISLERPASSSGYSTASTHAGAGRSIARTWYPTMRMFRQRSSGDRGAVFAEVRAALGNPVRDHDGGREPVEQSYAGQDDEFFLLTRAGVWKCFSCIPGTAAWRGS
jgi:hypothetical protein